MRNIEWYIKYLICNNIPQDALSAITDCGPIIPSQAVTWISYKAVIDLLGANDLSVN